MKNTKLFHAWWCLAFLMIGFVFMTRMNYGVGLYYADDFAYVEAALNANEDGWYSYLASLPNIYANRVSVVIPVAFCMKLFGSTEGLLQYVALAFSLGAIACAFLLGEVLSNRAVGFLAAIVASFIPLEIRNATAILPDVFIPFYAGMSLLCLLRALCLQRTNGRNCAFMCCRVFSCSALSKPEPRAEY